MTTTTVTDRSAMGAALRELKLSGMLDTLDARLAQARDAGLLEQVRGGADQAGVGGQRGRAGGRGGHDLASRAVQGCTASLVTVPGIGMMLANEAGPRRNAAAPPSPAAAGSASASAPAARMPLIVR